MQRVKRFELHAKQRGIALIQVLITTSIIMLLMVFFLTAAKSQVNRAQALQDKTTAYLAQYSTNNAVLFKLLTTDMNELRNEGWNFHGVPFKASEYATVAIQDLNGLLSLATLSQSPLLARTLAPEIGGSRAQKVAASVVDWIDADDVVQADGAEQNTYDSQGITIRNRPIQSFTELAFIDGMSVAAEEAIIANTTLHPTPFFNPMTAPRHLLNARLQDQVVTDMIISMRGRAGYTRQAVEQATGMYAEEEVNYLLGPGFRLTIDAKVADSFFGKVIEYELYPYRKRPVEVLSRLPRQQLSR